MKVYTHRRQALSTKGFVRRLADMKLDQVDDPRDPTRITYPLEGLAKLCILSIDSGAGSARGLERRSRQLKPTLVPQLALPQGVADNTLSTLVPRLDFEDFRRVTDRPIRSDRVRPKRSSPSSAKEIESSSAKEIVPRRRRGA